MAGSIKEERFSFHLARHYKKRKNGIVKRRNMQGRFLQVVPVEDFHNVLSRFHRSGLGGSHSGYKKIYDQVKKQYSGIPRIAVQAFTNLCQVCQIQRKAQISKAPLNPIVTKNFLHRVQIDLVNMTTSILHMLWIML